MLLERMLRRRCQLIIGLFTKDGSSILAVGVVKLSAASRTATPSKLDRLSLARFFQDKSDIHV